MELKPMKILIIEDDINDCNNFLKCLKSRNDFELIAITDSDVEALNYVQLKHPEGIVLDIELNNSNSGNTDSLEFLQTLNNLNLDYRPIIIVTTHINSQRTYEILHRYGVDIILYKNHPTYSCEHVLNKLLILRDTSSKNSLSVLKNEIVDNETKISNCIYHELDLIGITPNLKGRKYIHDAIFYLLTSPNSNVSVMQYLTKIHHKSSTTITNGIQNAIIHAWRVSSIEDLSMYYTARINYETGLPTPMEFVYFYVDKIKKLI
ncbi:MAG: response regulator [Clostridia bacterium]|jgi:DNA-binding NarL/FixJ family response regulator|nr:response regulator [Clostridia bacterium]